MPTRIVARLRMISRMAALNGWTDLMSTMPAPIDSGVKMHTVNMKLWNIGSSSVRRSSDVSSSALMQLRTLDAMFPWVSIAPLDLPVVPDV